MIRREKAADQLAKDFRRKMACSKRKSSFFIRDILCNEPSVANQRARISYEATGENVIISNSTNSRNIDRFSANRRSSKGQSDVSGHANGIYIVAQESPKYQHGNNKESIGKARRSVDKNGSEITIESTILNGLDTPRKVAPSGGISPILSSNHDSQSPKNSVDQSTIQDGGVSPKDPDVTIGIPISLVPSDESSRPYVVAGYQQRSAGSLSGIYVASWTTNGVFNKNKHSGETTRESRHLQCSSTAVAAIPPGSPVAHSPLQQHTILQLQGVNSAGRSHPKHLPSLVPPLPHPPPLAPGRPDHSSGSPLIVVHPGLTRIPQTPLEAADQHRQLQGLALPHAGGGRGAVTVVSNGIHHGRPPGCAAGQTCIGYSQLCLSRHRHIDGDSAVNGMPFSGLHQYKEIPPPSIHPSHCCCQPGPTLLLPGHTKQALAGAPASLPFPACPVAPALSATSVKHSTVPVPIPLPVYLRTRAEPNSDGNTRTRKCRRSRTVFSELQLMGLERRFEEQKYLSTPDRGELAHTLGLTQVQVKTWYQNRRMKWKKQVLQGGATEPPTKPKGRPKKEQQPEGTNHVLVSTGKDLHQMTSLDIDMLSCPSETGSESETNCVGDFESDKDGSDVDIQIM